MGNIKFNTYKISRYNQVVIYIIRQTKLHRTCTLVLFDTNDML